MYVQFSKMHGLGNDYILIDERDGTVIPEDRKSEFASDVCERGFGVGSDGVLFLSTEESVELQMRIFNADGSEAESCGNGLRCAAYYHHGLSRRGSSQFAINLPLSDVVEARVKRTRSNQAEVRLALPEAGKYKTRTEVKVDDHSLLYHRVDTGNPHAVVFLEENNSLPDRLDEIDLSDLGPRIQNHPDFESTGGINAEFVSIKESGDLRMRVHERGVGETSSCGTGCLAAARACHETGRNKGWVVVHQPGGALRIETEKAFLEGTAEAVYTGYLPKRFE